MKILKKSKSLRTKMNQNWLNNAEESHFWILWRFKILLRLMNLNKIILDKKKKDYGSWMWKWDIKQSIRE